MQNIQNTKLAISQKIDDYLKAIESSETESEIIIQTKATFEQILCSNNQISEEDNKLKMGLQDLIDSLIKREQHLKKLI